MLQSPYYYYYITAGKINVEYLQQKGSHENVSDKVFFIRYMVMNACGLSLMHILVNPMYNQNIPYIFYQVVAMAL